jgi:hypothetical protein
MGRKKKVSDDRIIESYRRLGNIWKVAEDVGICGQSVCNRLKMLGIPRKLKRFSERDKKLLKERYVKFRNNGDLAGLAKKMGRTKQFICRQAKKIGLTDMSRSYSHGKRSITDQGYVYLGHQGLEHIVVAEKEAGRKLLPNEVVHHKDEDRQNNAPENLKIMDRGAHTAYHARKNKSRRV